MTDELLVDVHDGVLVITLNRPRRRNAIDMATAEALSAALDDLDGRPELRVGILTGAGGTFCAGMDLKAVAETGIRPITKSRGELGMVRRPPVKPILAAVQGHVLGGGFELALSCDLIVAADDTSFGTPEVLRGQVAAGGGAMRLPTRLPHHLALELLLTGEPLPARRAYDLGLVNRLVPTAEVLPTALELARLISRGAPLALAVTKRLAIESAGWTLEEQFQRQTEIVTPVRESADAAEGARAFTEKRPPQWQGR